MQIEKKSKMMTTDSPVHALYTTFDIKLVKTQQNAELCNNSYTLGIWFEVIKKLKLDKGGENALLVCFC